MEIKDVIDVLDPKLKEYKDGLKTEVTQATDKVNEKLDAVVADMAKKGASIDEINETLKEMQAKAGRLAAANHGGKSFKDGLKEGLEANTEKLKSYKQSRSAISMDIKAVGNMGAAQFTTSGTQNFVDPTYLGPVGRKPYEISHIRDIVRVQPISTDSAFVIRDAAGEGGPTAVAMGIVKPQSDRDYVKLIVPVTKIAHYFKIPEELLEDITWLSSEISAVGVEDLMAVEDNLILNQVGAAGLFAGLTTATNSTAYSTPAALALAIDQANNYDVLVATWTQLRNLKNKATYVLVNPSDYSRMILTKATTGEYVFGAPNISIPNIFGIPILPHTAITSGKFLMGDFGKVALGQRAGISVRFYDQNEDDAIKNMVTVVIEERLTVVVDRADRLIYGDFAAAKAALETP